MDNTEEKQLQLFLRQRAEQGIPAIVKFLETIIHGREECLCPHCKGEVQAPATPQIRIAAVKAWKELVLDKVKANKRADTKEEESLNMKEALEQIARARRDSVGLKNVVPIKKKK
jgi:hypothetical protein